MAALLDVEEGLSLGEEVVGLAIGLSDDEEVGPVGNLVDGLVLGALVGGSDSSLSPAIWSMCFLNFLTFSDPRLVTGSQPVIA